MGTLTAVHEEIRSLLTDAGIDAIYGPREHATGRTVTLWPTGGVELYTRHSAAPTSRTDRVDITCAGPTGLDALAVAGKVRRALAGRRLAAGGGRLTEDSYTSAPVAEPNANPARYAVTLSFTVTTKGFRS